MKTTLSNLASALFCVLSCLSCTSNGPQPDWNKVRAAYQEYESLTYGNYRQGDTVCFLRETGKEECYIVQFSGVISAGIAKEQSLFCKTDSYTEAMNINIHLTKAFPASDENDSMSPVCLAGCVDDFFSPVDVNWWLAIDTVLDNSSSFRCGGFAAAPFDIEDDERYVENGAGQWMVLKKGVGIQTMGDDKGHTYALRAVRRCAVY